MWRVEEVYDANKRALQPGWDYVVDTGFDPSKAPIQPANKKRTAGKSGADTTAKQNDAILKRLKELDKDNHRDVAVAAPKAKDTTARARGKTLNTRKILAYQKAFSGWLDQEKSEAVQMPSQQRLRPAIHPRKSNSTTTSKIKVEASDESTSVVALPLASDGTDDSHLLQAIVPTLPTDAEMERLCSAPPLSYDDSRAGPSAGARPVLQFCEVCGYWGNIKCITCGLRVCGLICKRKHDVACQKYGGR